MHIRIHGIDFRVKFEERLEAENRRYRGRIDSEHAVIELDSTLDPQIMFRTAWHEAVHGIFRAIGFKDGMPEDEEEELIQVLAAGIAQVLQDNSQMASVAAFVHAWRPGPPWHHEEG